MVMEAHEIIPVGENNKEKSLDGSNRIKTASQDCGTYSRVKL
jgi:hypothetical protein